VDVANTPRAHRTTASSRDIRAGPFHGRELSAKLNFKIAGKNSQFKRRGKVLNRVCAASESCDRRAIRRALVRRKEAFHSLASGAGCERRFGVERDLT
jgi:hypothetical protein